MASNATPPRRLEHLDGLRGFAALIVIFHHLVMAFCPDFGNGNVHFVGRNGWMPLSPLSLLWAGNLCVAIFFTLSGYVLAPSILKTGSSFVALVVRRLVRLTPPVFAALLFAYAIWDLGLMHNVEAAPLGYSVAWLGTFYPGTPHFLQIFTDMTWMPVKNSKIAFDPPMWTMHPEYIGSFGIFVVYLALRRYRIARICALLALVPLVWGGWYVDFVGGALLSEIEFTNLSMRRRLIFGIFTLIIAADFGLFTWSYGPGGRMYFADYLPGLVFGGNANGAHQLGGIAILAAICLSGVAQRLLSWRPAVFLGHNSFGIYLLHFPIVCSAGSYVFARLRPDDGFWIAFPTAAIVTIVPTILLAIVFTHFIDGPSNTLSHRAGKTADKYLMPLWNRITTAHVGKTWRRVPHGPAS
jgi:peptidoglycan/LPS O-acetylase OafA/YrhL